MGIRLRRILSPSAALDRGEYTLETRDGRPDISCPACGYIARLADTYNVSRTGVVTPIWSCPSAACSYMDWITLNDHEAEVLR